MQKRIKTTPKNPDTYNSSTIYDFTWLSPENCDGFDKGKLIVRFKDNNVRHSPGSPSSAYLYDVPEEVYLHMKRRAENPNQYDSTVGEFYNNQLANYIDDPYGNLYESKHKI